MKNIHVQILSFECLNIMSTLGRTTLFKKGKHALQFPALRPSDSHTVSYCISSQMVENVMFIQYRALNERFLLKPDTSTCGQVHYLHNTVTC